MKIFQDMSSKSKIEVGDVYVVYREIDNKMNYNICLFTGEYPFDKLVYQEMDPQIIAEELGENYDGEETDVYETEMYEPIRLYLNKKFGFARDQIAVLEIINNNNDKKLIDYLEEAKTKDKAYVEYIGKIEPQDYSWKKLNDVFMSENNAFAVSSLIKMLSNLFESLKSDK